MNGGACDYTSVTDMIQQTWPGGDDYSRNIVGRLTADSGAVTELAEALDERSATPEDAWMMFSETVGKLSADDLNSIADWLDGAEVLTGNLPATTSTETYPEDTHWVCSVDRETFDDQPGRPDDCPTHGTALWKVVDGYAINPWSGERDRPWSG